MDITDRGSWMDKKLLCHNRSNRQCNRIKLFPPRVLFYCSLFPFEPFNLFFCFLGSLSIISHRMPTFWPLSPLSSRRQPFLRFMTSWRRPYTKFCFFLPSVYKLHFYFYRIPIYIFFSLLSAVRVPISSLSIRGGMIIEQSVLLTTSLAATSEWRQSTSGYMKNRSVI